MEEHIREVWTMQDHVENLAAIDAGTVEERRHDPDLLELEDDLLGRDGGRSRPREAARPVAGKRALRVQREQRAETETRYERGRSAARDHPSAVEQDHSIAQALRFLHEVRAVQDRSPAGGERALELVDAFPRLRVDADGRLVEQHDAGSVQDAAGQIEAPRHPARVFGDRIVGSAFETDERERSRDRRAGCAAIETLERREVGEVFPRGEGRVDGHPLRDETEGPPRTPRAGRERVPGHLDLTRRLREQRRDDGERGRLAGAVRAEQRHDLARPHLEAHAVEGAARAIGLDDVTAQDGSTHRTSSLTSCRSTATSDERSAAWARDSTLKAKGDKGCRLL